MAGLFKLMHLFAHTLLTGFVELPSLQCSNLHLEKCSGVYPRLACVGLRSTSVCVFSCVSGIFHQMCRRG